MARNTLAGTKTGKSKSALFYQNNPEARAKKQAYDSKKNKSAASKLYRASLNRANAKDPKSKPGDGKDMSHKKKKGKKLLVLCLQKNNRAGNSKDDVNSRV